MTRFLGRRLPILLVALGCGTPAAPLDFVEGCTSATLGPVSGVTPRITWPEDCGVAVIAVVPVELNAEGGAVWAVAGEGSGLPNNILRSGVTYGQEPQWGRTWVQPSALSRGRAYRVELRRTSFSTRVWGAVVASAEFTP